MVLQESWHSYLIDVWYSSFLKTQRHARVPPIKEFSIGLKIKFESKLVHMVSYNPEKERTTKANSLCKGLGVLYTVYTSLFSKV